MAGRLANHEVQPRWPCNSGDRWAGANAGCSVQPGWKNSCCLTVALEADQIAAWQVEGVERPADTGGGGDVGKAASDSKTFGAEGHQIQIEEMVKVVREGKEPTINGPEGRKAVELVLAIYESAKTGKTVELPLK